MHFRLATTYSTQEWVESFLKPLVHTPLFVYKYIYL